MRSMVEGARADGEILWRQEKRRLKRPSHRKSGPPSPLSRGGMKTYDNKNSGRRSGV